MLVKRELIDDHQYDEKINSRDEERILFATYIYQTITIITRAAYNLGICLGDFFYLIDCFFKIMIPSQERCITQLYSNNMRYCISGVLGQILGFSLFGITIIPSLILGVVLYIVDSVIVECINSFRSAFKEWLDSISNCVKEFNNVTNFKLPSDEKYIVCNSLTLVFNCIFQVLSTIPWILDKFFPGNLQKNFLLCGRIFSAMLGYAVGLILSFPIVPSLFILDKLGVVYEEARFEIEKLIAMGYVYGGAKNINLGDVQDKGFFYNKNIHSKSFNEQYTFFTKTPFTSMVVGGSSHKGDVYTIGVYPTAPTAPTAPTVAQTGAIPVATDVKS